MPRAALLWDAVFGMVNNNGCAAALAATYTLKSKDEVLDTKRMLLILGIVLTGSGTSCMIFCYPLTIRVQCLHPLG